MKYFEIPEMNISMFEVENVVTTSTGEQTKAAAVDEANAALTNAGITSGNKITVTF